jgi:hypothetical protein
MPVDRSIETIQALVGGTQLRADQRTHPAQGVLTRLVLEGDDAQLIAPAGLQMLLDCVDPGAVPADNGHPSRSNLDVAIDLIDATVVAKILALVHESIHRA